MRIQQVIEKLCELIKASGCTFEELKEQKLAVCIPRQNLGVMIRLEPDPDFKYMLIVNMAEAAIIEDHWDEILKQYENISV